MQGRRSRSRRPCKELLPKLIKENKRIIFNGNNYSEEWREGSRQARPAEPDEHRRRAARARRSPTSSRSSRSTRSSTTRELHARYEIDFETYVKTVNVEAQLMVLMAEPLHPAGGAASTRRTWPSRSTRREGRRRLDEGGEEAARPASAGSSTTCARAPTSSRKALEHHAASAEKHAKYMRDTVVPAMAALREAGDQHRSCSMPHELWPLPTYREMLFIK